MFTSPPRLRYVVDYADLASADHPVLSLPRSRQGRTTMQNAAKRGYARHPGARATTRDLA
jgi:hypothetical protein